MRSAANHSKEYASRLSQMGSVSDQCLELVERDATAQVAVGDAEHVSRELVTRVVRGHDVVLGQAYRDHPPELVDVDPSVPVMVVEAKSEPEPLSVDTEHQRPDANQELVAAESVPQGARTHARARRAAPCRTSEGRDARERRKSGVVCRGSVFTKCSGLVECRCWRRKVSRLPTERGRLAHERSTARGRRGASVASVAYSLGRASRTRSASTCTSWFHGWHVMPGSSVRSFAMNDAIASSAFLPL